MRTGITFEAVAEALPGAQWQTRFTHLWPAYRDWFLSEGDAARPTYGRCIRELRCHMPDLLPTYESLCDLAGGGDTASRFLAMYCPPPYLSGCTQAVWTGEEPVLVRNYDYSADRLEGIVWNTAWNGRQVMAMSDGLWGVLDGMNDSGLAVSLAFGGRLAVGEGFGIPVILRYILEFCDDAPSAIAVLRRIPTHMSYNVTLVDKEQRFATVYVAPDRKPVVRQVPVATNFQGKIEWPRHAWATATVERESAVLSTLANSDETEQGLVATFLRPPVLNTAYERGFGTLYTAVYRPLRGSVDFLWPGQVWPQSFEVFGEGTRYVNFAPVGPRHPKHGAQHLAGRL